MTTLTTKTKVSPCCKARWLWHQIWGMRLFRAESGRKLYDVRCEACNFEYTLDGGSK